MDPERRERFCLHAALALGLTAFFASATLGLAPVEYFHQLEQRSTMRGLDLDFGPMLAFGLMGAMFSTLVAGLLAWVGWRSVLPAATYLVVLVVLSIPAALLGGLVGGVVGSAQLNEVVGGNERRLPPVRS